ncbi:MAG: hypothetical protein ACI4XL_10525 [Bacillus sp. (in: firmicutes)]
MKKGDKSLLYFHMNGPERFVLASGVPFQDFCHSLSNPPENILLLKHKIQDTTFDMHTKFEYVGKDEIPKMVRDFGEQNGEFCWIDFEDESNLSNLQGQSIAELLYLGHSKQSLRPPFYPILNNQFVYLSDEYGDFSKVYFRDMDRFFYLLGTLIPAKLSELKIEQSWLRIRKADYPGIPIDICRSLTPLLNEGLVISFKKISKSRNKIEIPVWVTGDQNDADDVAAAYKDQVQSMPDALIQFLRKTKEWVITIS